MPKNGVGVPFSLSLLSEIEKVWMRGLGEERQDFPSKISCLTVPKNIVGQRFWVSLNSGIEKLYAAEGYVTTSVKISCLTVPKNAVGEPFCHCLILGIESLVKRGGGGGGREYHNFLSKTFVSQCRKFL